jgi:hypothetical protein
MPSAKVLPKLSANATHAKAAPEPLPAPSAKPAPGGLFDDRE